MKRNCVFSYLNWATKSINYCSGKLCGVSSSMDFNIHCGTSVNFIETKWFVSLQRFYISTIVNNIVKQ